ncbi:hypothetical protein NQZ68_003981 [Dissostichus eleginoides]|nr:hypothetical protein NQZ68_003981 [Dissostichus eleginoides]
MQTLSPPTSEKELALSDDSIQSASWPGGAAGIQRAWTKTSPLNSATLSQSYNISAGHQPHVLNHTVELIQFICPGSRYGAITSLLTECGGGATPECSGNGQSAQLNPLQEE